MLLGGLCLITGCSRYRNWAAAQFEQACMRDTARCAVDSYIQSSDRWDGFTTIGRFDALWYTRPVAEWQIEQFRKRVGVTACAEAHIPLQLEGGNTVGTDATPPIKTAESCAAAPRLTVDALREKLSADLEQYAIFYLLMTDDTNGSLRPQLSLDTTQTAVWSALLRVGTATFCPLSIERVCRYTVDPALVALFGPRYEARYRNLYRIAFAREALQGHELLADMPCMQLVLRSVAYEIAITWTADMVNSHRVYSEHIR
jgi:hypothetical protein